MKVILLQDVARIGKRHEIVTVPDGHALNLLIPKGQAQPATPENVKRILARKAHAAADQSAAAEQFAGALESVRGTSQTMAVEANDQGHLFKGIKADTIASFLSAAGMPVSAAQVLLPEPIKATGEHQITLQSGDAQGTFTLVVVAK